MKAARVVRLWLHRVLHGLPLSMTLRTVMQKGTGLKEGPGHRAAEAPVPAGE